MIQILRCRWCNADSIPLDGASCNVQISANDFCESCSRSHERKYLLHFCSAECMCEYFREKRDVFFENVENFKKIDTFPMDFVENDRGPSYESVEKF